MQFVPFEEGIEVNGYTVYSVIEGLGQFKSLARKYLLNVGIGQEINGKYELDRDLYYSHEKWLKAFQSIARDVGESILFEIGSKIPKNAKFPKWVTDINSAIQSIDIAYHINHRKNGAIMFDEEKNLLVEGIGHYGYEKIPNKNMILSVCNNPYPCSFDRGILHHMARRFEITASVIHDESKQCRRNGADSCTYIITW